MSPNDPLGIADAFPDTPGPTTIYRLDKLESFDRDRFSRRPLTVRLLAENLARNFVRAGSPRKLLNALVRGEPLAGLGDLPFFPGRVLLQDFTGVPVLVDLTALRSAAVQRGLAPERVNPIVPVDLVVDHSVQVDSYGSPGSIKINLDREYDRNSERYVLLRWAQQAYA
ncbi:MAG TPA: aconitase family protein, partial [Thermoplasmata archaeon]|nr:aconitase family protein [Thermoplasmata archaeon]